MQLAILILAPFIATFAGYAAADDLKCPQGTVIHGETTPEVREAWCETTLTPAIQHGPYKAWWPNGVLGTVGQYNQGVKDGEWRGWDKKGKFLGWQLFQKGVLVKEHLTHPSGGTR